MRVGVTGSTGFLGSALCRALEARGDEVVRFVRPSSAPVSGRQVRWDPARGHVDEGDLAALGGLDAVINLAGVSVAGRRRTRAYRDSVKESRRAATSLLVSSLATLPEGVGMLISSSAVGYYGSRGDEVLDEDSSTGQDFLSEVCRTWEAAAAPFAEAGGPLATIRTGIVLGAGGGVLERLVPLFRVGLGGVVGSGRQWIGPISLRDYVAAVLWIVDHRFAGTFNLCAPEPCTNRAMTRTLARALHRPGVARVPAAVLRGVLGREMADNTVLASQRVVPAALVRTGFVFADPDISRVVASALG